MKNQVKNQEAILSQFSKIKVLVLGDLILDGYLEGNVERISPEAPVPVLEHKKLSHRLGGAANVALNLASLGVPVALAGVVGADEYGRNFRTMLAECHIDGAYVAEDPERPTSLKTRVIANQQQLLRIDQERLVDLDDKISGPLFKKIEEGISGFQAVIISDYGKGVIHAGTFSRIQKILEGRQVLSVLDPKKKNFGIYRGVDSMTHNHHEASEDSGLPCDTDEEVKKVGPLLIEKHGLQGTLITRGGKGMALFNREGACDLIPTFARSVFDVSGAGDTVIAVFTAARAAGADPLSAAVLANHAAGVVVSKFGTATLTMEELRAEIKARE